MKEYMAAQDRIVDNRREKLLIDIAAFLTLLCFAGLAHFIYGKAEEAWRLGYNRQMVEISLFAASMLFIAYGTMLYMICLRGYYTRRIVHCPARREELEAFYDRQSPALTILAPAYKEERSVIWQTLMSAALSEYPAKNVVLLIDDPYQPNALEDMLKLEDARRIPQELQTLFDAPANHYREELEACLARRREGAFCAQEELKRLGSLYQGVANWLEGLATDFAKGQPLQSLPHADRFFVEAILLAPAKQHRALAEELKRQSFVGIAPEEAYLERQYKRLIGLFDARFSSFERKKYVNLSHEANKAMNLNAYIGLIGKSWREVETAEGLMLQACAASEADVTIPVADYVNTLDVDSFMLGDYAIRMVHHMEQPGNARVAVIQSSCSSFPGSPHGLERVAGAGIDVQFRTHQGYTHWNATFWVGANAMLRKRALEEIRETTLERGYPVSIYIQDRTVIEDTESSIDLVDKGWQLYNYPERMTFSATPPDFGSLLIQRRRWANGGLIILPKLLGYAWRAPKTRALCKEMFMRLNYLAATSIGCVIGILFFLYPFGEVFSSYWLPLGALPFLLLYARDLRNAGYQYRDCLRMAALNLMLIPVIAGGVLKQFQQMITGKKIPFGRTPKVTGRTAAPALYCVVELLMLFAFTTSLVRNIGLERWEQAAFSALNLGFMLYAITCFIGLRALGEDLFAGIRTRLRKIFHHAQIIPLPGAASPARVTLARRRA